MSKTLYSLGVILTLLSFSYNATAHSGTALSSIMHSTLHLVTSISLFLALMIAVYIVSKQLFNTIKQRVKK